MKVEKKRKQAKGDKERRRKRNKSIPSSTFRKVISRDQKERKLKCNFKSAKNHLKTIKSKRNKTIKESWIKTKHLTSEQFRKVINGLKKEEKCRKAISKKELRYY